MKIAEALIKIKEVKGKLASLLVDISSEQYYEQLDVNEPIPNVDPLISDYCTISQQLADYKARINKTNIRHGLAQKIYRMEALRSTIKQFEGMTRAKQKTVRLHRVDYEGPATQLVTYTTYNVEELAARIDKARAEIREIDLDLQRQNWQLDLEE
jgi:hypothetical protein